MLLLQNIAYAHPGKQNLFQNINLSLQPSEKVALVGNNGTGKSTLLQIIAGDLQPIGGTISAPADLYYVPQQFGVFNDVSVAGVLKVAPKLKALQNILEGNLTELDYTILDDDWNIVERCRKALDDWQLNSVELSTSFQALSGGQKMRVLLAGIAIHEPAIILLDEPSNHLDRSGRRLLYNLIQNTRSALIVVSHDRELLNLVPRVFELSRGALSMYGGNYDFYLAQKMLEQNALQQQVATKEKELRKAKEVERESLERQQKLEARGRKKQDKAGLPTIMLNTYRNNAESTSARLRAGHEARIGSIKDDLLELRERVPDADAMKLLFNQSHLHANKTLVKATDLSFKYDDRPVWNKAISFVIGSRDRIVLKGDNGSGKTTLIKLILGALQPANGTMQLARIKHVYADQDYSLLENTMTVYELAQKFNDAALREHEIKSRLNRFLFTSDHWDKHCEILSGGEKMRLMLCCLTIAGKSPDMIVLDEPTNNLDIQNVEILAGAIAAYEGALVVVSHDQHFLKSIRVEKEIDINLYKAETEE